MAKSKHKQALNRQIPGTANPNLQQQNLVEMSPSTEAPQGPVESAAPESLISQQQQHDSNTVVSPTANAVDLNVSATSTAAAAAVPTPATATATPPVVTLSNFSNQQSNPVNITTTSSSNLNTSPSNHSMSPSVSTTFHSHLNPSAQQQQQAQSHTGHHLSSSISTSSMHLLASSISTDRLSNVQLNPSLLDDDEIGHAIPTPECLPQSRKHSIVQSKLATPTLSSS